MSTQRIGGIGVVGVALVITSLLLTAPVARADEIVNWSFDLTTTGQDAAWTSPTTLDTGLAGYQYSYEITQFDMLVNITLEGVWLPFFPLSGSEAPAGNGTFSSLPTTLVDGTFGDSSGVPGIHVTIGVDATGQGTIQLTNVQFGQGGIFSISGFHVVGNVSISPGLVPEPASAVMLLGGVGLIAIRRRPSRRSARA
ncbi:MAG TPA: PEP-CTERM sorting domain-containing protein [Phycisphaeraceae bacterium]